MVIDEAGAQAECAVVNQEGELIVGRDEAFYFNTVDGRGPCFACEGTSCMYSARILQDYARSWSEIGSARSAQGFPEIPRRCCRGSANSAK